MSWMVIAWVSSKLATLIAVTDTGVVCNDSLRCRAVTMISSSPVSDASVAGGCAAVSPLANVDVSAIAIKTRADFSRFSETGRRMNPVAHWIRYDTDNSPLRF